MGCGKLVLLGLSAGDLVEIILSFWVMEGDLI